MSLRRNDWEAGLWLDWQLWEVWEPLSPEWVKAEEVRKVRDERGCGVDVETRRQFLFISAVVQTSIGFPT